MNISSQGLSYQHNNQTQKAPIFTAIPKKTYELFKETGKATVCQLDKSDIPMLKNFVTNMKKFFLKHKIEDESRQQVVEEAFQAGIKILENNTTEDKAKIFMAMHNGEPCGIIIGNVRKNNSKGITHYSSRKNHGKDETELDWLATWNTNLKGVGKALVNAYYSSLSKDGFKTVYVRSEIPQKSGAVAFYKSVGFSPLSTTQRAIQRKHDNGYIIGNYDALEDTIIPMKASASRINDIIKSSSREMKCKEVRNPVTQEFLSAYIPTDKSTASKLSQTK